ncbi:hypothetical protein GC194_08455 [bacterium]|nr:hypothetical protein [bacterium]
MKQILFILLFTVSLTANGKVINTSDFITEIKEYDISDLWTADKIKIENEKEIDKSEPLGYIGDSYQRFYIHFISAIKNPNNKLQYFIYGKTKVKENVCTFQGTITIIESRTYDETDFPDIKQGYVKGSYEFFEDSDQSGTGVFKGTFQSEFYIDKSGVIAYDALMFGADGYKNNQFEGTWISYLSGKSKKCNWGEYRIPDSYELDRGAGEFFPNPTYSDFGWLNYELAWLYDINNPGTKEARLKEKEEWWK